MMRFGTVSEVDTAKGLVRVTFAEDDIVSYWLSVSVPSTKDDSFCSMPDIGEHVYCVMDENAENGVVGGAVFSADHLPALDTRGIQFKDGTVIKYDRESHKLTVSIADTLIEADNTTITTKVGSAAQVSINATTVNTKVSGAEHIITATGHTVKTTAESLKQILSDILDGINAITHPETGTVTGTPNNAATFAAIKTRLNNLFQG